MKFTTVAVFVSLLAQTALALPACSVEPESTSTQVVAEHTGGSKNVEVGSSSQPTVSAESNTGKGANTNDQKKKDNKHEKHRGGKGKNDHENHRGGENHNNHAGGSESQTTTTTTAAASKETSGNTGSGKDSHTTTTTTTTAAAASKETSGSGNTNSHTTTTTTTTAAAGKETVESVDTTTTSQATSTTTTTAALVGHTGSSLETTGGSSTASSSNTTSSSSSAASASASNLQTSLELDPALIGANLALNGQAVQEAGQVPSLTSTDNFINFCAIGKQTITNGQQVVGGSCNPVPMGQIPAKTAMPSCKFTFPQNFGTVKANTNFTITLSQANLDTGNFVNAQTNYYSAPQQLNGAGLIIAHNHVVVEELTDLKQTKPTDPTVFKFFKGLNEPAVNGILSAVVVGGLPKGVYKVSTITTSANHVPVLGPVAQHGSFDDVVYFTAE